tara:strand:- start:723 stop:830 length:108 start_codon:yes stop_codon:yes gene_type:complete
MEISGDLLYRIYNNARQQTNKVKPIRTHYNANTFG